MTQLRTQFTAPPTASIRVSPQAPLREGVATFAQTFSGSSAYADKPSVAVHSYSRATSAGPGEAAVVLPFGTADTGLIRAVSVETSSLPDPFYDSVMSGEVDVGEITIGAIADSGLPGAARTAIAAALTAANIDHLFMGGDNCGYAAPPATGQDFAHGAAPFLPWCASGDVDITLGNHCNEVGTAEDTVMDQIADQIPPSHPAMDGYGVGRAYYDHVLGDADNLIHVIVLDGGLYSNMTPVAGRGGQLDVGGEQANWVLSRLGAVQALYRIVLVHWGPVIARVNGAIPELAWLARTGQVDVICSGHKHSNQIFAVNYGRGDTIVTAIATASQPVEAGEELSGAVSNVRTLYSESSTHQFLKIHASREALTLSAIDTTGHTHYSYQCRPRPRPAMGNIILRLNNIGSWLIPALSSFTWADPGPGRPCSSVEVLGLTSPAAGPLARFHAQITILGK